MGPGSMALHIQPRFLIFATDQLDLTVYEIELRRSDSLTRCEEGLLQLCHRGPVPLFICLAFRAQDRL